LTALPSMSRLPVAPFFLHPSNFSMKATRVHEFGDPEVFGSKKSRPQPRRGQVLIRMCARGGGQTFWEIRITGERRVNEDTDIDSNIGVTAHGVRPDGATTDNHAGADQGNRDDGAGEREENASRTGGAWQSAGKT